MLTTVIRKEHKNDWEKRTAITPNDFADLLKQDLPISVEPSDIRIFDDESYAAVGASLSGCPQKAEFVVGIKEPPVNSIQADQVHLAFSHTIKGQDYNMPLLHQFMLQKATLIDYEPIVNAAGKRTIAFGRFAGIAGAIDSFFVAGQKYQAKGLASCLANVKQTWQYDSIDDVKADFAKIDINQGQPVQVLIVGTGNVGKGSEEVCQWLGLQKVDIQLLVDGKAPQGSWYAVASSRHINQHKAGEAFNMAEFIEKGTECYQSSFETLLGQFSILLQTPYWTEKYPKHLTKQTMLKNLAALPLVVGDISCDINGSLECTSKISDIDRPAFTYDVTQDTTKDGVLADGISVMAIDNLPCELSKDASEHFSNILKGYLPNIMAMDLTQAFENCGLIDELAGATIVYKGELTPKYKYLEPFLQTYLDTLK